MVKTAHDSLSYAGQAQKSIQGELRHCQFEHRERFMGMELVCEPVKVFP